MFNTFISGLVFSGFTGSGLVFMVLEISRTGYGPGPSKKGKRTGTRPDFKALITYICRVFMSPIYATLSLLISAQSVKNMAGH